MKNIYYLIGVLAVILFISFFLGNVNTKEGLTTPDNVKIATDAINNSSSEQKAQIANVLAPPTAAAAQTPRATAAAAQTPRATAAAAQTTRAPIVPTVPIAAAQTTRAPTAAAVAQTTRAPTAAAVAQTTRGATAASAQTTRGATAASAQTTRGATAASAQTTRGATAASAQTTRGATAASAQTTRGATAAAAAEVMITNLDRQKLNEISKRYINQSTYINNLINHDTNFKSKVDIVLSNTQRINDDLIEIKEIIIDRLNK